MEPVAKHSQNARPVATSGKLTFDISMHYSSIVKTLQSLTKFSGNDSDIPLCKSIICGTHLTLVVSDLRIDFPSNSTTEGGSLADLLIYQQRNRHHRPFSTNRRKTYPWQTLAYILIYQRAENQKQHHQYPQTELTWAATSGSEGAEEK